jgi:D-alanyl-D-alanine carboxypeptidase (penicillin-binding protein 5/6)
MNTSQHSLSRRRLCLPRPIRAGGLPAIAALALACASLFVPDAPPALASPADEASDPTGGETAAPIELDGDFVSAVVMDANTGWVLIAKNPYLRRQPASMLKMMTELIVLEHVAKGYISLSDTVTVSARASRMGGSQVYLKQGERFTVEELLSALAVQSANDAAVALAEHVAGSVEAFVDLMNMRAGELGMTATEFHSVHGLPPGRGQQPDMTTAYDLALLGREVIKYDRAREWASTATAPFRNGKFIMYNPNKLIGTYRGLDGIKTGYHGQAGFCVTASATRRGKRLISVVMGCSSDRARATETTRLLTQGFNLYTEVALVSAAGDTLPEPVKVRDGEQGEVAVAYAEPLTVTVPKQRQSDLELRRELPAEIAAPVAKDQEVGHATAYLDDVALGTVPIVAVEAVARGNWLQRLFH